MILISIRNHYDLSQRSLADILGVSRTYVKEIESGRSTLSERLKRKCYELFNVAEAVAAEEARRKRKERLYDGK